MMYLLLLNHCLHVWFCFKSIFHYDIGGVYNYGYLGLSPDWVIRYGRFSQISSCYLFMIAQISNRFVIVILANSSVCQLVPFLMYI